MTPSARVQAATDLLDAILRAARDGGASADAIASQYFRDRRYMGSKDRRAVRDLAWRAIRRFGDAPETGRSAMVALAADDAELGALFDGSNYGPAPIDPLEPVASGAFIPSWLIRRFDPLVAGDAREMLALLERAPLDVRINRARGSREMLAEAFPGVEFSDHLPQGARLPAGTPLDKHPLHLAGAVEVQDWGSQAIVAACAVDEATLAIDLCAGAGGKTLALADNLPSDCRIIAADIARARLQAMPPRLERAGVTQVEQLLLDPGREWDRLSSFADSADLVLVDAPCSGTGTWRRNPETRWRLTEKRLERVVQDQAALLRLAARLVRPGGILVYAVCSLLAEEGRGQIASFLSAHPEWRIAVHMGSMGRMAEADGAGLGQLLSPAHDGSDGFFFARLERLC